ncbi:MAG: formylglycine-generating enzyme family protein [Deltaproteobacteria bacterium]|nr:formylglycine-generating enzyme family protein [Deltaproteobacteria bacterium]
MDAGSDAGDAAVDAAVDAGPERCTTEGEFRAASCGDCGTTQETCTGGFWVAGVCLAQGECAAGALEEDALALCEVRTRICQADCSWLPWETTTPAGECEAGDVRDTSGPCEPGFVSTQTCGAVCAWDARTSCVDTCPDRSGLRTSPWYAEEVCVPDSDFIRGLHLARSTSPAATVHLSSYAIDRFPVSNRRYAECRAAGVCVETLDARTEMLLADPIALDTTIGRIPWHLAVQFCEWDGRRLPTEAEFEKAQRGPAPRTNEWEWDGDAYRCDLLPVFSSPSCPGVLLNTELYPLDSFPGVQSFYGMRGGMWAGRHWMSDLFLGTYYDDPASLDDPQGPAAGCCSGFHARRGELLGASGGARGDLIAIGQRHAGLDDDTSRAVFRCARSLPVPGS